MSRCAGVDWASEKHAVFVQNADGERVFVDTFAHDERGLGENRLAAFLARHAYGGRKTPAQLLTCLREAQHALAGEAEIEARRAVVLALAAALKPLAGKISELTSEVAHRVRAHPDGPVFLSLFKDPKSVICTAMLLVEIGDCRGRYPTPEARAAVTQRAARRAEREALDGKPTSATTLGG